MQTTKTRLDSSTFLPRAKEISRRKNAMLEKSPISMIEMFAIVRYSAVRARVALIDF